MNVTATFLWILAGFLSCKSQILWISGWYLYISGHAEQNKKENSISDVNDFVEIITKFSSL